MEGMPVCELFRRCNRARFCLEEELGGTGSQNIRLCPGCHNLHPAKIKHSVCGLMVLSKKLEVEMKTRFTIAVLFVLLAIGIVASLQALPPGGKGHDYIYYSDDTFNTAVGERYMDCDELVYNWGSLSPYAQRYEWDCLDLSYYCGRYYCSAPYYT